MSQVNHADEVIIPVGTDPLNVFSDSSIRILRKVMLLVIFFTVLSLGYGILSGHAERFGISTVFSLIVISTCYWQVRRGKVRQALSIYCWGYWLYACILGFMVAGIRTPILVLLPSMIMITAWAQGRYSMFLMTSLSTICLLAYVIAENNHMLPIPIVRTATSMFITYMTVIITTGAVALVIAENVKRLVNNGNKLMQDLHRRLIELRQSDEALRNLNNQLEQRVYDRTALYDEANKKLQGVVVKLETAQKELLQSEKLASLGSMVAGISHELNTPVGNALTITSSLEDLFREFQERVQGGHIKRSELDEFVKTGLEMAELATKSTKRAVDLVASFKQVAVDQTSEQRRAFNLHNVIDDNLATLLPTVKKQHKLINIENRVANDISCDSYPGPLGQIIVNLTQNAILHGFFGRDGGNVIIDAAQQGDVISLTVTDDGVGMPPNILAHVFDPFFTTKLGKGGSGIGLSISHRIATSLLGGNLSAISAPGQGATFTLTMPKAAPFKF